MGVEVGSVTIALVGLGHRIAAGRGRGGERGERAAAHRGRGRGGVAPCGGPGLAEECRPFAPISPGECVITGGHELPNPHVIHCLGPVHGVDEPAEQLLASCYRNALTLADERGLASVAFPAISTGAFGYPMREAAEVALRTVLAVVPELTSVRLVRFVLYTPEAVEVHRRTLSRLVDDPGSNDTEQE